MPYRHRLTIAAVLGLSALLAIVLTWATPQGPPGNAASVREALHAGLRSVTGLSLVNDTTRRPVLGLSPITDGTVLNTARSAGPGLSLRADLVAGVHPGSVEFTMTGARGGAYTHTDSTAPYLLCDNADGCPLATTPDAYTLSVQPYTDGNGTGDPLGPALSVHFTVTAGPGAAPPLDVLFVGNSLLGSYTEATREDTPALVRRLAAGAGRTLNATEVIHSGYTLQQTWNDGLVAGALDGTKRYDYIVLQEYSTLVATDPAAALDTLLHTYAPAFARVLKPGGRVVLFKNWALADPAPFPTRAAATTAIDTNYAALSAALTTPNLLAPIGDEFETLIAAEGTSYLIVPDGKHPNDRARYLDAATLYGILFHDSPRTLADLYLSPPVASRLRSVAAAAIGY